VNCGPVFGSWTKFEISFQSEIFSTSAIFSKYKIFRPRFYQVRDFSEWVFSKSKILSKYKIFFKDEIFPKYKISSKSEIFSEFEFVSTRFFPSTNLV